MEKNESGKTAFLQALYKLNPSIASHSKYDAVLEFPKKRYSKYKAEHSTNPATIVEAEFALSDEQAQEVENLLAPGCLTGRTVTVSKGYGNSRSWDLPVDEKAVVQGLVKNSAIGTDRQAELLKATSFYWLKEELKKNSDKTQAETDFEAEINSTFKRGTMRAVDEFLNEELPTFVYFDDYSIMPGSVVAEDLLAKKEYDDSEQTFLSLLEVANAKLEDFQDGSNYERLKSELESASISITDQVFEYWSQNKNLEVEFDIQNEQHPSKGKQTTLHIRIKNQRHRVTVPFSNRSRGFVWFFSFLAYFSTLDEEGKNLVLLLDEPGINLHAKAQGDFLRFIDEKLAPDHQVIYTTHSPFMIEATRFDRVRTVEDTESAGTIVSQEVLKTDQDTVFPLQAALGYDLAQTLFLGPNCLLVEGPSDLIYLQIMSELCKQKKKSCLSDKWVVTPVGGADKLAAFISLMGSNSLNCVALMDFAPSTKQKIDSLVSIGLLEQKKVLSIAQFTGKKHSDIEDMFEESFYIDLFNGAHGKAYGKLVTQKDVAQGDPRILGRIEAYFRSTGAISDRVDHFRPASYLLRKGDELSAKIDDATIDRFAALFDLLNTLLK